MNPNADTLPISIWQLLEIEIFARTGIFTLQIYSEWQKKGRWQIFDLELRPFFKLHIVPPYKIEMCQAAYEINHKRMEIKILVKIIIWQHLS